MYGFVVTTAGQGMLARASAGETLTLTGVQVGKGVAASREAALALTALIDPVANGTSTEPAVSGNQLSMIVEYRNDMNGGLEEGFDLSEFGVLARVGDDAPALLYYASLGDSPQPVQPESAGLDVHRFPVAVAVTDEVTVTLGYPAEAFVTADALEGYVPLGEDGKVPGEYLPEMDYIPTSQKGAAGGVASLDDEGKLVQDIDCGVWDADPVAEHNATATAHANLLVDGNNVEAVDTSESLEEHMANPLAHQNLVIDGNAGQ